MARYLRRQPTASEVDEYIAATRGIAADVRPGDYQDFDVVSKDPKDNPVIACAIESGAEHVVSDDKKHLLSLKVVRIKGYRPVQIVLPEDFLATLARR